MTIERMYLITWIQRTVIHLHEICDFLRGNYEVLHLNFKKLDEFRAALNFTEVTIAEQNDFETLTAYSRNLTFTAVEDGILALSAKVENVHETRKILEGYYKEKLGPALAYLFGRGAPLPKELSDLKEIYPILIVVKDASEQEVSDLYKELKDEAESFVSSKTTKIFFGRTFFVIRLIKKDERRDEVLNEWIDNIVFIREFYKQLRQYLNLHRTVWDHASAIRESSSLRYKDFPIARRKIMDFLKTLFFVKARLAQMEDIVKARQVLISPAVKGELEECGLYRFESAFADCHYIRDLWDMTIEYAQETLHLLESFSQENIQRELGALKFITLIAALTGFFGMNIAFPWEERWPATSWSFFMVVFLITGVAVIFYYLLRFFIYNRRFSAEKQKK